MLYTDKTLKDGPEYWGAPCWLFLEAVVLGYFPDPNLQEQEDYRNLFESLRYTLPCRECAEHYTDYLEAHPVDVSNKYNLLKWLIGLHNDVNRRNKKSEYTLERFMLEKGLIISELFE